MGEMVRMFHISWCLTRMPMELLTPGPEDQRHGQSSLRMVEWFVSDFWGFHQYFKNCRITGALAKVRMSHILWRLTWPLALSRPFSGQVSISLLKKIVTMTTARDAIAPDTWLVLFSIYSINLRLGSKDLYGGPKKIYIRILSSNLI